MVLAEDYSDNVLRGEKMMKVDLIINNGMICADGTMIQGGVAVKDGIIVSIGDMDGYESDKTYDAGGKLVLPGVIDPHTHLGIDKDEEGNFYPASRFFTDCKTESQTAVVGGVTTFNTTVRNPDPGDFTAKMEIVRGAWKEAYCDMKYYGGVANDEEVAQFNEYRKRGICSTPKLYLGFRGEAAAVFGHPIDGYSVDFIYRAFRDFKAQDGPINVMVHAEDTFIKEEVEKVMRDKQPVGENWAEVFNEYNPGVCEVMDLCKTAWISQYTNCPLYIVHISAKETVENLEWFLEKGFDITGETCLHYLLFSTDDPIAYTDENWNKQAKVSPPIRKDKDRDALWEGIRKGVITCVGTDHVNYSPWMNKLDEPGHFWEVQCGCGDGMSTLMTGVFTEGVHKRHILDVPAFCKLMSENPAKAMGIYPKKGAIKVGADADIVVFDPNEEWVFDSTKTYSTHVGSLYDGYKFKGRAVSTFVRGIHVAEKGKIIISEPIGEYVKNVESKI